MSEAKSPGTWLELTKGWLARFTGVLADPKREATPLALEEKIKQTVQGAHADLKACERDVAKHLHDNKPEDLAANLHTSATQALRRTCKAVHLKAKGAILFLERKTQLGDCMVAIDHNNGVANNDVHNNGVANNGVANNGVPNNGVPNNGVPNNGDGIGSECGGLSPSPLCQSNCLAPTSPTTAYHPSDTTQPASKKQRVAPPIVGHLGYLPGGCDSAFDFTTTGEFDPHTAFDFTTTCNSDLLVLNAFDEVSPIAPVEVAREFVIGNTGTALADSSERGYTSYQLTKHTVLVAALLAIRTSGPLSGGYGIDSFKRLQAKMTHCMSSDKSRFITFASQYKASLVPSAGAAAEAKSTSRIAICTWVELLFRDRFATLEGAIVQNNLLHSCTMNMNQCGGDKSGYIHTGANDTKTSSKCTGCLCENPTCIFALMSTVVDSKVFGGDTTSVGGQLEHEHIVAHARWSSFS
jgi:hypothetical protein